MRIYWILCALLAVAPALAERVSCPTALDATRFPSASSLTRQVAWMNSLGPRYSGNAAHRAFTNFVADEMSRLGLSVTRDTQYYTRRDIRNWTLSVSEGPFTIPLPVASYVAGSGLGTVRAEIAYVHAGSWLDYLRTDVKGKIVVLDLDLRNDPQALYNLILLYQNDPAPKPPKDKKFHFPQSAIGIAHLVEQAASKGAVGVVVVLSGSPANAAGHYWGWGGPPSKVPAVMVDRVVGAYLSAPRSKAPKVTLQVSGADIADTSTDMVVATLPGAHSDEALIVNTHTDGPNAFEDNGGIGMIAMAEYLSRLPLACRRKEIHFVFATGHMDMEVESVDRFMKRFPDVIARTTAAVTVEHLGATGWADDGTAYRPTGYPYAAEVFASNAKTVAVLLSAIQEQKFSSVKVLNGSLLFIGEGIDLQKAGVPTIGYIPMPTYLASWASHGQIDKFDGTRMAHEVRLMTALVRKLDAMPAGPLR